MLTLFSVSVGVFFVYIVLIVVSKQGPNIL